MNVTQGNPPLQTVKIGGQPLDFAVVGSGSQRPALVMVHGGQCSCEDWFCLIDQLADRYTIILPDGLVNPFDGWMVWQLLDHLDIQSAILLGHSWGGTITQQMYRLRPHAVRAIVDVDSKAAGNYILARKQPADLLSDHARALVEKNKDRIAQLRPHHQGDYPSEATFTCRFRAYERHDMTPEQKAATRPTPEFVAELSHRDPPQMLEAEGKFIKCPCLQITTGRGKISQADYTQQYIAENSWADNYEVICIKEAGHWPWLEDKQQFMDLLLRFLEKHAASKS